MWAARGRVVRTYLVWGPESGRRAAESLSCVRWVGNFHPAYKINSSLVGRAGVVKNVDVFFDDDGKLGATQEALTGLGARIVYPAQPDRTFFVALTEMDAAAFEAVSRLGTVLWLGYSHPEPVLDDEMSDQIQAGNHPGGITNPVTPGGSSTLTIGNTGAAAAGSYPITVSGSSTTGSKDVDVELIVYTAAPGAPTLTTPADGAVNVSTTPTFTWSAPAQAETYTIEVATDAGFTNVVASASGLASPTWTSNVQLAPSTLHHWRVRAVNVCGTGSDSAAFSFTTAAIICNPTLIDIPASGAATPYPSAINVVGQGPVLTDVKVHLVGMNHTWPDDIDILLVAPGGQNLIIMSDAGGSNDLVNVDLIVDDAAAGTLPDSTQIVFGSYRPTNFGAGDTFPAPAPSSATTLATFGGTDPNGTWSLYVTDDTGGDLGNVSGGWCLETSSTTAGPPNIDEDPPTTSPCRRAPKSPTATRSPTPATSP